MNATGLTRFWRQRSLWGWRGGYRVRIKDDDTREAEEVGDVEGQEVCHAVKEHGRDESSVMGILPQNAAGDHEPPPLSEEAGRIWEQWEERLNSGQLCVRLGGGEPQTIYGQRPSSHHPQLVEVLWHQEEQFASAPERGDGVSGGGVHGMGVLCQSSKDVAIQQNAHSPRPS